jgi:hypothetical protein
MDERTARDHVRVALRLHEFPRTTEKFVAGEISYSKVRAITRAGRPELEGMLLRYASAASGGQLERIVRHLRRLSPRVDDRYVELTPWERADSSLRDNDDGTSTITLRMPTDEALRAYTLLQRGSEQKYREAREEGLLPRGAEDPDLRILERAKHAEQHDGEPATDHVAEPLLHSGARMAQTFLDACERWAADGPVDTSGRDRHLLVVHADSDDLSEEAAQQDRPVRVRIGEGTRRAVMSPRVLRRLSCNARYAVVGHGEEPGISGTTSTVPPRIRRLLHERDRTCRFPGCGASLHLDAHHVHHVADGGPTELTNLVLLCRFHHSFVHARNWEILHDGQGHFRFQPPGDVPLPPALELRGSAEPPGTLGPDDPEALQPEGYSASPDYSECVGLLLDAIIRLQAPAGIPLAA